MRIYYRLFNLLRGDPVDALYQVRIENSRIAVNQENDEALIELVRDFIKNREEIIIPNLVFSGRNLHFSYKSGNFSAELDRVFTRLSRGSDGTFQIQLRGDVSASFPKQFEALDSLQTGLQVFGSLPDDFSSARPASPYA